MLFIDSCRGARHRGERAIATLEFTGLALGIGLLIATSTLSMRSAGPSVGARAGERLQALVQRPEGAKSLPRRWQWQHEERTGGGASPIRVRRDQIRMSPVINPIAWWSTRLERKGVPVAGINAEGGLNACVLCLGAEWSHDANVGVTKEADTAPNQGVQLSGEGSVRAALASAQMQGSISRSLGASNGHAALRGSARATAGSEADASADIRFGAREVAANLEAGAMVGAAARAETRVGVNLLGIAIQHNARAEGWAGAGLRGSAGITFSNGSLAWKLGWGGALGLGGATEWSGSIGISKSTSSHRKLEAARWPPWK